MPYVDTKVYEIGRTKYCAYCGKEANEDTSWSNHYPDEYYYNCDCEVAKKEIEIQNKIQEIRHQAEQNIYELEKTLPKPNDEMVRQHKYDHELQILKRKHNIV